MTLALHQPERLEPAELDAYLASGWYRVGQSLMTCRFLLSHNEVRSTIWTRTRLAGHRFGRSTRKLLLRNDRRFRITLGEGAPAAEREARYRRFLAEVGGDRAASLAEFLAGGTATGLFCTEELAIWEGDRLVAFSWFDQGDRAMQSLIGVYDPDYRDHSLGLYSLLCEVRLADERGLDFHYSGYVVIGDPCMDYKLRAGGIEFLDDRQKEWRPWADFRADEAPLERILACLERLESRLQGLGVAATLSRYPAFDLPARHRELRGCLDAPALLTVPVSPMTTLLVTATDEGLRVELGQRAQVRFTSVARPQDPPRTVPLWVPSQRLGDGLTEEQAVRGLLRTRMV